VHVTAVLQYNIYVAICVTNLHSSIQIWARGSNAGCNHSHHVVSNAECNYGHLVVSNAGCNYGLDAFAIARRVKKLSSKRKTGIDRNGTCQQYSLGGNDNTIQNDN